MKTANRAFTLVELIITVLVIGLFSAAAIVALGSVSDHGNRSVARSEAAGTVAALDNYWNLNGELPPTVGTLDRSFGASVASVEGTQVSTDVTTSLALYSSSDQAKVAKVDSNGDCWLIFRDYSPSVGSPHVVYSFANNPEFCLASLAASTLGVDGLGSSFLSPVFLP